MRPCGEPAWKTRTRILVENGMYFAANPQLLADEDRLANMVNIPPFDGQQAVQLAVAQATEHLLLGRTAEAG